jgi:glycosyltransferase involved in cell wall biosynthesis
MKALARRGHKVVWPPESGGPDLNRLVACDAVHVYRRSDPETMGVVLELVRRGTPVIYDNDDDFTGVPKESPNYDRAGALRGQRAFAASVKIARQARVVTTTSEPLAEKYQRAGAQRVEVIANYLAPDVSRPHAKHDGIVIGWIAALEHMADAARIDIAGALERIVDKHRNVRVECIGVDLRLPERYRHDAIVLFPELPSRIARFDIGIAPLADLRYNRARSDIKVKEYAASGVPWLASPVGPYATLGEDEGGRLVPDEGWFEALDRLVTHARERRKLARKAKRWAKRQTIDAVADRWERVFVDAAG